MRKPESSGTAVSRDPTWTQRHQRESHIGLVVGADLREMLPRLQADTRPSPRARRGAVPSWEGCKNPSWDGCIMIIFGVPLWMVT